MLLESNHRCRNRLSCLSALLLSLAIGGCISVSIAKPNTNPQFLSVSKPIPIHSLVANSSNSFYATGFFHTQFVGNRWWLVTPQGQPFYSSGVDHVSSNPDTDQKTGQCPYCVTIASKYSSISQWTQAQVTRMREWGFNTVGAFSDYSKFSSQMPYTVLLSMASGNDWFAQSFATNAYSVAQSQCAPLKNDPNLIGYYSDSELHWGPDWRSQKPILDDYLNLPIGSPGRIVAEEYKGNPSGFLYALATRYFQVTSAAIHSVDPNHLILGVKAVAQLIEPQLLEAATPYVDVFSIDDYQLIGQVTQFIDSAWPYYLQGPNLLGKIAAIIGKPIMIGEYSFRASDSGLTNSWPPIYPIYQTQGQRAAQYQAFVSRLYEDPYVVGDEWFEYVDEPYNGRFDGEDSNFGILSTGDVPYSTLIERMQVMHALSPQDRVTSGPQCISWTDVTNGAVAGPSNISCNAYAESPANLISQVPIGNGLWELSTTGEVFTYGDAVNYGGANQLNHRSLIVSMDGTPDGTGYWMASQDGGVYSFGAAQFYGSAKNIDQSFSPIVSLRATPDGSGYWLLNSAGQVYAFGSAQYLGGAQGEGSAALFTAMAVTKDGNGYWLLNSAGQVYAFGDAQYFGGKQDISSYAAISVDAVSITSSRDSRGYLVVLGNGTVLSFGDAPKDFQLTFASPTVAIVTCPSGGYWIAQSSGSIISVAGASDLNSNARHIQGSIVAIAN